MIAPPLQGDAPTAIIHASPVTWGTVAHPGRARAARGTLARLVAVLAVVAGFALLHAPQCDDGMISAANMASVDAPTMSAMITVDHTDSSAAGHGFQTIAIGSNSAAAQVADEDGRSHHAALMGCVALLITMVGFVVLLLRPVIPLGRLIPERCWPQVSSRVPRPPNLTALCVLRT